MWNLLDRLLSWVNARRLEGLIRQGERNARLAGLSGAHIGAMVRFTAQPRPAIKCPACGVSFLEQDVLERSRGRVGVVVQFDTSGDFECINCKKQVRLASGTFPVLGVRFKGFRIGAPAGVWAFPSELTVLSRAEYDRGDVKG